MKARINAICLALAISGVGMSGARAQQPQATSASVNGETNDPHVALTEQATAADVAGRVALGGRLRTTSLAGTPEAPLRDVRFVVENRSPYFYNYVSGWTTFYDAQNVRCGEGLWKVEAFAPGESAEVDTPGLRLTCTPATWRISALNLLTRAGDVAKPGEPATPTSGNISPQALTTTAAPASSAAAPRLEIKINGKRLPLQLGNPVEIVVGQERVNIVVQPAP